MMRPFHVSTAASCCCDLWCTRLMLCVAGSAHISVASRLRSCTNDVLHTGLDTVFMATAASRYSHYSLLCCYTHTHPFNGPMSGTTQVSQYQKCKTNLDFTEARESVWQRHQLGRTQVCTWLQTDNHASTPLLLFLQARCTSCCPTNSVKALKANNCRWRTLQQIIANSASKLGTEVRKLV